MEMRIGKKEHETWIRQFRMHEMKLRMRDVLLIHSCLPFHRPVLSSRTSRQKCKCISSFLIFVSWREKRWRTSWWQQKIQHQKTSTKKSSTTWDHLPLHVGPKIIQHDLKKSSEVEGKEWAERIMKGRWGGWEMPMKLEVKPVRQKSLNDPLVTTRGYESWVPFRTSGSEYKLHITQWMVRMTRRTIIIISTQKGEGKSHKKVTHRMTRAKINRLKLPPADAREEFQFDKKRFRRTWKKE